MNLFKGIKQNTDVMDNVPGGNQVGRGLLDAVGIFSAAFDFGAFFKNLPSQMRRLLIFYQGNQFGFRKNER